MELAKQKQKKAVSNRRKTTLVKFILDETASMSCVKGATISGFNEYLDTLKKDREKGKILFTLTRFNSIGTKFTFNKKDIKVVKKLTDQTYRPDGMTPLYDAIGKTICYEESPTWLKNKNVLVVIMTDGEENCSKEYTRDKIFDLIKKKEKDGWTFVYLGANQDSYEVGMKLGMNMSNVVNYDQKKTKKVFGNLARATTAYCSSAEVGKASVGFFDDEKEEMEQGLAVSSKA